MRLLSAFVLLALAACKSKPQAAEGAPCPAEGRVVCGDANTALLCRDGKYAAVPCAGADGCARGACDDRVATVGAPCIGERHACSGDRSLALACERGAWAKWRECRGGAKCAATDGEVRCDESLAQPGDACEGAEGAFACTPDGAGLLGCDAGKLELVAACNGGVGCRIEEGDARRPVAFCEQGTPKKDAVCREPASLCEPGRLFRCEKGRWREEACARCSSSAQGARCLP